MKILLDTNVILDIVLERQPFVTHAVALLRKAQQANIELYLTATTITDLYIVRKAKGKAQALEFITDILATMAITAVDKDVLIQALHSGLTDFEDAVQVSSAQNVNINAIVTRNVKDFQQADIEVYTPEAFIGML